MSDSKLLISQTGTVLTLTLNRPEKLNAIDNELAEALLAALQNAVEDNTVRAIRINANGRAFCAGRDVSHAPTERDLALVQAVARAIVHHPKPVLAAVHGWVVGAGLEWMLNADIVLVADDARFKLPEASLGVFVTGGLVATLPAAVGLARAKALLLLGEAFDARQAADWGLLYRVLPRAELDSASLDIAHRLSALQPAVALHFKRVLNQIGLAQFDAAVEEESRVQRLLEGNAGAA